MTAAYAQAATHRQRAIELGQAQPDAAAAAGIDVPRLHVQAIDALYRAGDSVRAGLAAEEAYRRFAGHADPATAAVVRHRAAVVRANDAPAAGLPLMEEALRLFEQAPPSFDHANALLKYATTFLLFAEEQLPAGDRQARQHRPGVAGAAPRPRRQQLRQPGRQLRRDLKAAPGPGLAGQGGGHQLLGEKRVSLCARI